MEQLNARIEALTGIKPRFTAKYQLVDIPAHSAQPKEGKIDITMTLSNILEYFDMISSPLYAFIHTGTDLEAALERIKAETVDPFDDAKNGKFYVAEIFLE